MHQDASFELSNRTIRWFSIFPFVRGDPFNLGGVWALPQGDGLVKNGFQSVFLGPYGIPHPYKCQAKKFLHFLILATTIIPHLQFYCGLAHLIANFKKWNSKSGIHDYLQVSLLRRLICVFIYLGQLFKYTGCHWSSSPVQGDIADFTLQFGALFNKFELWKFKRVHDWLLWKQNKSQDRTGHT